MRISDWSSDVCSSDLLTAPEGESPAAIAASLPATGFAAGPGEGPAPLWALRLNKHERPRVHLKARNLRQDRGGALPHWPRAPLGCPQKAPFHHKCCRRDQRYRAFPRSEEHTSELQSLMRIS